MAVEQLFLHDDLHCKREKIREGEKERRGRPGSGGSRGVGAADPATTGGRGRGQVDRRRQGSGTAGRGRSGPGRGRQIRPRARSGAPVNGLQALPPLSSAAAAAGARGRRTRAGGQERPDPVASVPDPRRGRGRWIRRCRCRSSKRRAPLLLLEEGRRGGAVRDETGERERGRGRGRRNLDLGRLGRHNVGFLAARKAGTGG